MPSTTVSECSSSAENRAAAAAAAAATATSSPAVWSLRDKSAVRELVSLHTTPTGTHGMPVVLVDVIMSFFGHLWVGSRVDVQDQIGKYVHAEIIDVSETTDVELKDVRLSCNCQGCGALSSSHSDRCSVCGMSSISGSSSGSAQDSSGGSSAVLRADPAGPSRPTAADLSGTRVKVSFFGWDADFDEWVTLDRVWPGGSKLTSTWLKRGAVVCLGSKDLKATSRRPATDWLMACVLDMRPSTTAAAAAAAVPEVRVQVDATLPFSFRAGQRRRPSQEEVDGVWVALDEGRILENGSFCTGALAADEALQDALQAILLHLPA